MPMTKTNELRRRLHLPNAVDRRDTATRLDCERLCALTLNRLDALDTIQNLMNGRPWSADTLDIIAEELRRVGYAVTDLK